MKKLFANKRATAWLGVCVLWGVVFIITIAWPKEKWIIPPTCFWCSIICDFETGKSLSSVLLTMPVFASSISVFIKGHEQKIIRVFTDLTTIMTTVYLIYLGIMRIYPNIITPNFGYIVFAIGILSHGGMLYCAVTEFILYIYLRKQPNLEEDQND